jgi:predicted Zn-dependent protease
MGDLRDAESELTRALARLSQRTRFAEVLAERSDGRGLRYETRSVELSSSPHLTGAIFRAWGGSRWVEAATSAFDVASVTEATESVERALDKGASRSEPPGPSATTRKEWTSEPARPMRDMGPEALTALARDVLGWATEIPQVRGGLVLIGWEEEERFYLNTAGARCFRRLHRVRAGVIPLAFENGRVQFDIVAEGGLGGQERLESITQERVRSVAKNSVDLLHAKTPPTGELTVLLDPSTTGTFAHESFGHGTEADQFVRDRSYLKPLLGQNVGPQSLTIVDDGAHPGSWGTIFCDDEGHEAGRTVLVDRGRFVGALHDRDTAASFHVRPTGNTRRADVLSRAFVRMTNTFVEPQDWTFDELVKEAKDGVVLERATSGIEDPLGGQMQLKVKKGHRIEHGEVTDLVSSMALSGKVLDFLKAIRGVGVKDDFEIEPGSCGKGHTDLLPVGTGGVYLLSRAVVGPA